MPYDSGMLGSGFLMPPSMDLPPPPLHPELPPEVRITGEEEIFFRTEDGLKSSLRKLDGAWREARTSLGGFHHDIVKAREAAAMTAHARWMYRSGLRRTESRGMHLRTDATGEDARFNARLLVGGLDRVWTRLEQAPAQAEVVQ